MEELLGKAVVVLNSHKMIVEPTQLTIVLALLKVNTAETVELAQNIIGKPLIWGGVCAQKVVDYTCSNLLRNIG